MGDLLIEDKIRIGKFELRKKTEIKIRHIVAYSKVVPEFQVILIKETVSVSFGNIQLASVS